MKLINAAHTALKQGQTEIRIDADDAGIFPPAVAPRPQTKTEPVREPEPIDDELLFDAMLVITKAGKASMSLLRRELFISQGEAAKLIRRLESKGYIGRANGTRPRIVNASAYSFCANKQPRKEPPSSNPRTKDSHSDNSENQPYSWRDHSRQAPSWKPPAVKQPACFFCFAPIDKEVSVCEACNKHLRIEESRHFEFNWYHAGKIFYVALLIVFIFLAILFFARLTSGTWSDKSVHVNGYTRKDGTQIAPYTRSAPGSGGGHRH